MQIGGRPAVRPPPINRAPSCIVTNYQHPHALVSQSAVRPAVRPHVSPAVAANVPTLEVGQQCGHTISSAVAAELVQIGSRPAVGQLRPNAKCKLEIGQQCGHHQSIERRRVAPLVVRMQRFVNLSLLPTSPRVGFTVSSSASSAATRIASSCRQRPHTGSRPAVRP